MTIESVLFLVRGPKQFYHLHSIQQHMFRLASMKEASIPERIHIIVVNTVETGKQSLLLSTVLPACI
jgi:hypothetical protein